ncbi:class D sortase [Shimazuella alba]|uniref:Class D sortase n=1 Tax=Shimazuella alba TaxID=2690964 RepID=A0A6I4W3M5_9BACL|nr:class D sortase [Shimazuella alba]MXQ54902.1 class D sortase [Shimazuella alba]
MKRISLLLMMVGVCMMGYTMFTYVPQMFIGSSVNKSDIDKVMAEANNNTNVDKKILYPIRPKTGENVGELIIPKLNAILPIIEGTDPDELEKGVGHYAQSVLPGEKDNAVLSGHRDTVFRNVGKLEIGDQLVTKTSAGVFTYKIVKMWVVDEDDRTVIVSHKGKQILTLTTCYPFNFIGPAPQRYIIQSVLIGTK